MPGDFSRAARATRQPVEVWQAGTPAKVVPLLPGETAPTGAVRIGILPPLYPEWLGDRGFQAAHGTRFAYVAGEMARGLATRSMVSEMARHGGIGFFGAAGLSPTEVEAAMVALAGALGPNRPWGSNLIHSPSDPGLEDALVDLYLRLGVRRVCASAFMSVTPSIVRFVATGLRRGADGRVIRRNLLFAKVSRAEIATAFMSPAPAPMLAALSSAAKITSKEVELAAEIPLAEDITAEADSGGHTDNRPLTALVPLIVAARDRLARNRAYRMPIRVGAAGGLGSPAAIAAAFALGAAYVVTGSVNQSAVESGLSPLARVMLASVGMADVAMAPSADMFELGVKVQVLKKGSLFAARAQRLYDLYKTYDSLEAIPAETRARLESEIFRRPLAEVWQATRHWLAERDPTELARAERDSKLRMALTFRWYVGLSSRWPIEGKEDRKGDFQIWCGPAMGAFNDWVAGSFLEAPESRSVGQIALNLLEGAAVWTRAQQLRNAGVDLPQDAFAFRPRRLAISEETRS
jgi:trans-AT polyketide synthase, acyltransferase and oxidoreductase domains